VRCALALALAGALAGCSAPRTEMVIGISSNDLSIPGDVDALALVVRDHSTGETVYSVPPTPLCPGGGDCLALPTAVTLFPGPNGPHDVVEVEVQALKGSATLIDDAATFTFADGQSQELEFVLYRSCLHTDCAMNPTLRSCIGDLRCGDVTPVALGADLAMGGSDQSPPADLATADRTASDLAMGDLSAADQGATDLAAVDATVPPDLAPPFDFAMPADQSAPPDLSGVDFVGQPPLLDNATNAADAGVSSLSWGHTVNSFPEKLLVGVCTFGNSTVQSISYGAAPMNVVVGASGGGYEAALYYLDLAPRGTQNVTVTLTGSQTIAAVSASFYNATQGPPRQNSAQGNSKSPSANIAGGPNDLVVGMLCTDGAAMIQSIPPTLFTHQESGASGTDSQVWLSASVGATSMSWGLDAMHVWAVILADLSP
jgi:hypothetical protein